MNAVASEAAIPRLGTGVRLHFDSVRKAWGLLAPERLFKLDGPGTEVMKLVDGLRDVRSIVDTLAERFKAPRTVIAHDVLAMLQGLADKNVIHL
ncbi:MAG TPA: pyrroloquinoline quinone biosynthesis peptide chaperone PqqD [Nevskiaceae bacterium]|nr:pyrroloquinoline quinone biosynthesis peptide chaperone PqqD [Nevskiaceae bacterium]